MISLFDFINLRKQILSISVLTPQPMFHQSGIPNPFTWSTIDVSSSWFSLAVPSWCSMIFWIAVIKGSLMVILGNDCTLRLCSVNGFTENFVWTIGSNLVMLSLASDLLCLKGLRKFDLRCSRPNSCTSQVVWFWAASPKYSLKINSCCSNLGISSYFRWLSRFTWLRLWSLWFWD